MSRSRRKTPIVKVGETRPGLMKWWKKQCNKKIRRSSYVGDGSDYRKIGGDVWNSPSDGKMSLYCWWFDEDSREKMMKDSNINTIKFSYFDSEKRERGWVETRCKNTPKFYEKNGHIYENRTCLCEDIAFKKIRYVNWMDRTGLIRAPSKRCHVACLAHINIAPFGRSLPGFDHTSVWMRPGDKWPLLILTEPYQLPNEEDLKLWNSLCEQFGLDYKISEPSQKSLWYPDSTYMIYWWHPDYFNMQSEGFKLLLCYEDANVLRGQCFFRSWPVDKYGFRTREKNKVYSKNL